MKKSFFSFVLVVSGALCLSATQSWASNIILDPALVSGTNAIDPAGDQTVDQVAAGSTPASVLEAIPELAAVQNFAGWGNEGQGTTSYIIFTDPTRADVKGSYNNINGASSGGSTSSTSLMTSPGNALRISAASTRSTSLTFDFGKATYSGTNVTAFNSGTLAPSAVGFTVSGLANVTTNVSVTFYGTDDTTVLSSQILNTGTDPDSGDGATYGSDGYVGYMTTGTGVASGIGRVTIFTNQIIGGSGGIGIDDLAYTTVGNSYYMTVSGSGTKDGSSWANSLAKTSMSTTLNTTMAAGDYLYIGSGSYGTQTMEITSSGSPTKFKHVVGVDTGTGKPAFSGSWVRTDPSHGTNHFINLVGTAGSGTNGVANWEFDNFNFSNCVFAITSSVITSGSDHTNITFRDIDITSVRHGMYMRNTDNMLVDTVTCKGYSKHAFRLDLGCDYVTFNNCVADLSNGDTTWWDHSEEYPFGFIVNNGGTANTNISFIGCLSQNNLENGQPAGFWNGDGFDSEANTVNISFTNCIAINNEDGGFDTKQASTGSVETLTNCASIGNANNFKMWYGEIHLSNCVGTFSRRRETGNTSNDLNGLRIQDALNVSVDFCTFHQSTGAEDCIAEKGAGSATVTNSILSFDTASGGAFTSGSVSLGTGAVTYRPGSGTDPAYVNPSPTWDGIGDDMNSQTYGLTKGYHD